MLRKSIGFTLTLLFSSTVLAATNQDCAVNLEEAAKQVSHDRMKGYKNIEYVKPIKNDYGNLAFVYEVNKDVYKTIYTVNMTCYSGNPTIDWIGEENKPI